MDKVIYKGVEYHSLRALCLKMNVTYQKVAYRMKRRGETLEEALTEGHHRYMSHGRHAQRARGGKEVVIKGVKYRSISEAARANGINPTTINQRLSYGYTIDEAFDFDNCKRSGRAKNRRYESFSINGKQYANLKDFCTRNGLSDYYQTIINRTRAGESLIDVVANPSKKRGPLPDFVEINGEKYRNYTEFCKKQGIYHLYGSFIKKIHNGMIPEEAYRYVKEIEELRANAYK